MALFLSFEGGERSGKSTQARLLGQRLSSAGYTVVLVREPGSTVIGQRLRRLVKGVSMSTRAELLLFGAARAELVETVIRPHLAQGHMVIADRFADSTTAYQQYGRRLPADEVAAAIRIATQGLQPQITFLLDFPPGRQRLRPGQSQLSLEMGERAQRAEPDDGTQARFERESSDFRRRVRAGYLAMARDEPVRWFVLNARREIGEIHEAVCSHVQSHLPPRGTSAPAFLDLTGEDPSAGE